MTKNKTCYLCNGEIKKATREHVCPQWIIKFAKQLGCPETIPWKAKMMYGHNLNNIKLACEKCNTDKAGALILDDTFTRIILKSIRNEIDNLLEI